MFKTIFFSFLFFIGIYLSMSHAEVANNLIKDPGFEGLDKSKLDKDSTPWFTISENMPWSIQPSGKHKHGGNNAVMFAKSCPLISIAQNLGAQLSAEKTYEASIWMFTRAISNNPTSSQHLSVELWSAPKKDGTYVKRGVLIAKAENSVAEKWEQFGGSIKGSFMDGHAGEYIQLRISGEKKSVANKISVDDIVFGEVKQGETPKESTSEKSPEEIWKDIYFKNNPEADSNKDGIFTWDELKAARDKELKENK